MKIFVSFIEPIPLNFILELEKRLDSFYFKSELFRVTPEVKELTI